MDPASHLISLGASILISACSTVVLAVVFWDSIAKINNGFLFWSMIVGIAIQIESGFAGGFLFLQVSKNFDFNAFNDNNWINGHISCFGFPVFLYHAAHRSLLIACPRSALRHIVPAIVFVCGATLNLTGLQYYHKNWQETHNLYQIPAFTTTNYVVLFYNVIVMVSFFLLSQITIIQSMSEVYKTPVSFLIVVKILARCIVYAALCVSYVLLASTFVPWAQYGEFGPHVALNLMIAMLLSDAGMVRDIFQHFNGASKTKTVSGPTSSQHGVSSSMRPAKDV
ncbi:hypothetical protein DFJ73DRAFT_796749 [Zopfochytrium polystomum]|nr:hypothetical protein DFJ73DRAFT_796749 [Zopfochytrium polystomum]